MWCQNSELYCCGTDKGINTNVSCLLLIDGSVTLVTSLILFVGSSTAYYVLQFELSSEDMRNHHTRIKAIFVMNSILSKAFMFKSRTSLPCIVGKPVALVEISFMFAPMYDFLDGRKKNPSCLIKRFTTDTL